MGSRPNVPWKDKSLESHLEAEDILSNGILEY